MTQPITRKRALEIAQECIQKEMGYFEDYLNRTRKQAGENYASPMIERKEAQYAELAAALAYIENLQRQKELL